MRTSKLLMLAALALPIVPAMAHPAMAHNEDRSPREAVTATAVEYSQNATRVVPAPRPDTSIPEKIAPDYSVDDPAGGDDW